MSPRSFSPTARVRAAPGKSMDVKVKPAFKRGGPCATETTEVDRTRARPATRASNSFIGILLFIGFLLTEARRTFPAVRLPVPWALHYTRHRSRTRRKSQVAQAKGKSAWVGPTAFLRTVCRSLPAVHLRTVELLRGFWPSRVDLLRGTA